MPTIKCNNLKEYFENKNKLIERGYIEIKNDIPISHGVNYIKIDKPFFCLTDETNQNENN